MDFTSRFLNFTPSSFNCSLRGVYRAELLFSIAKNTIKRPKHANEMMENSMPTLRRLHRRAIRAPTMAKMERGISRVLALERENSTLGRDMSITAAVSFTVVVAVTPEKQNKTIKASAQSAAILERVIVTPRFAGFGNGRVGMVAAEKSVFRESCLPAG